MAKNKKTSKEPQQKKYSTITQHKLQGKTLSPPMHQMGTLELVSWMNDRLPEMLWAILLITHLPRNYVLNVFHNVSKYFKELPENDNFQDITHTGLSKLSPEHLDEVLSIITAKKEQKEALTPLMLFDELPAQEAWKKALDFDEIHIDWELLMKTVSVTLWHKSQEATDCRWLRVLCALVTKKFTIYLEEQSESEQAVNDIIYYPTHGDQLKVGASIRANELMIDNIFQNQSEWAVSFWDRCFANTTCFQLNSHLAKTDILAGTTVERLSEVWDLLVKHTHNTQTTSGVDAQHDTVFGIGFYCLRLLQELLPIGSCNSISARTTLRTIAECYITLAYLAKKGDAELWQSYRIYGAGQAKLAFLKLDASTDKPGYVDVQTLEQLANEDMWQEFLNIDLGHWDNTDLRKMSTEAGVKDVYDRFYGWTSTYAHGHWGAIRDTVFDTCGNPLHRFHRIPLQSVRPLPDVIPDACELIDKILELVSQPYPDFPHRVTLKI